MSTLYEELIDAAENAALLGYHFRSVGALDLVERQRDKEARLRARAEKVREMEQLLADDPFRFHELTLLCGPISSRSGRKRPDPAKTGQGLPDRENPLFCEHANEVPQTCPCAPDCYCKDRTCRYREAA